MWGIAWPFLVAVWAFLFVTFMAFFFGRKDATTFAGRNPLRWRPVRRGLQGVFALCVGFGGLILVVSLPFWIDWGKRYAGGVPVEARVASRTLGYDAENSRHYTTVTYEFEAEADGGRRLFRREADLRGTHFLESGSVRVLYPPADPSDSRMVLEFTDARDVLLSLTSFVVLGVASFALLGRSA